MIVAELRAVPVGSGSSMERTVEAVCEALDDCEVEYEVGPVATTLQVQDLGDLMETIQCCQEAALETAPRVVMSVTIDQRTDRPETMQSLQEVGRPGSKRSSKAAASANAEGAARRRRRGRPTAQDRSVTNA